MITAYPTDKAAVFSCGFFIGHIDNVSILMYNIPMKYRESEADYMQIREYTHYNEDEILGLYTAVGWKAYTENKEALRRGFGNSLLILAAYEDDELLGIIRTVGDGATIVFVQDILVFPDRQRQGVGTALLREVLGRFSDVRQIELATDNTEKTVAFYRSMGFCEFSEIGCCGFMKCR